MKVANNRFSLGPVDGLLRVSAPLDRESRSNYTLHVTAYDRGTPSRSQVSNISFIQFIQVCLDVTIIHS